MAAPFILKVRKELRLDVSDAANLLQISKQEYVAKETGQRDAFDRDQLITLWNWMTPKMINVDDFVKLID